MTLARVTSEVALAQSALPQLKGLKKVSNEMEAHFVKELLQVMKKSLGKLSTEKGLGEDSYNEMFDDAVSNSIQGQSHLGIAQTIYKSMEHRVFDQIKTQSAFAAKSLPAQTSQIGGTK